MKSPRSPPFYILQGISVHRCAGSQSNHQEFLLQALKYTLSAAAQITAVGHQSLLLHTTLALNAQNVSVSAKFTQNGVAVDVHAASVSQEFVINIVNLPLAKACDYCGIKSGKNTDKFKETKLTKSESTSVSCKSVAECPLTLECKVDKIIPLGSHDMFIADIVAVTVDEKIVDEKGRLMLEKANLLAYSHGDYFSLGKKVGDFGFSVRKKKNLKRKRK